MTTDELNALLRDDEDDNLAGVLAAGCTLTVLVACLTFFACCIVRGEPSKPESAAQAEARYQRMARSQAFRAKMVAAAEAQGPTTLPASRIVPTTFAPAGRPVAAALFSVPPILDRDRPRWWPVYRRAARKRRP